MAHKIDEKTELRVSLKTLAVVIVAIVSAAAFVFHMEERLDILEMKTNTNKIQFESYREQPSRSHTDVEVMKKELEYLKKEIDQLKNSK
jgi:Tfp pilus assembly protein PilO|tara:strand:+ start:158 stop:424 length:267 start_codon:yes stop_codon:yes gene_type:complete